MLGEEGDGKATSKELANPLPVARESGLVCSRRDSLAELNAGASMWSLRHSSDDCLRELCKQNVTPPYCVESNACKCQTP